MNPLVPRFLQQLAPGARAATGVSAVLAPRFAPTPMREAVAPESVASQVPAAARHADVLPEAHARPLDGAAAAALAAPAAPPRHAPHVTSRDRGGPRVDAVVALTALRAAAPVAVAVAAPAAVPMRSAADALGPVVPDRSTAPMQAAALRAPLRESTVAHHAAALRAATVAPVMQVTIDRIDVRATPAGVALHEPVRRRAAATTSLADYLRHSAPGTRP